MVEYPRALRTAHHIVYFHPSDAQAFVAGKLAEASAKGDPEQITEWQKVSHFVARLLDAPEAAARPFTRTARPRRPRRSV